MFFVVFSLILIQCAKMFPSEKKSKVYYPQGAYEITDTPYKEKAKFTAETDVTNVGAFNNEAKPAFKSNSFPINVMRIIENGSPFNNTHINFNYLQPGKTFNITSQEPGVLDLSIIPIDERISR